MSARKKVWWGIGGGVLVVFVLLCIPFPFSPPGDLRMILDHNQKVYVAPPCFEQAQITNYLTETTWAKAQKRDYKPESTCTADWMKPVQMTMGQRLIVWLGVTPSSFPWWSSS